MGNETNNFKVESNEGSGYKPGYMLSIMMKMCKIHCYHKDHIIKGLMAANAIGLNTSYLVQILRFARKQEEIIMNRPIVQA